MDIDVSCTARHDAALVCVSGEIDLKTAPAVRDAIIDAAAGRRRVDLSLAAVTFLDVHGARTIDEAAAGLAAEGSDLLLTAGSYPVVLLLRLLDELSAPAAAGARRSPVWRSGVRGRLAPPAGAPRRGPHGPAGDDWPSARSRRSSRR
ncbi:MAG TPA: STAS domain-containing protein [Baekduia sp.]|nr:STAS domain-containing protein [Baekduia sp.]